MNNLTPAQRELLLRRLRTIPPRTTPAAATHVTRQPRGRAGESFTFPSSDAQESLWFLDRLDSGASAYNVAFALELRGVLDRGALSRAITELAARHETLRTTFDVVDGRPVQVVNPPEMVSLPVVDLRLLPESERQSEMRRRATEEAQRQLDLVEGPLFQCTLLRLDVEEHVLLVTLHHILADGWSMGVLVRDLAVLYSASPLPELPVQFGDFVVWRREQETSGALAPQLEYWKHQLGGDIQTLQLPLDRPRPRVQTFSGKHLGFDLSSDLTEQVRAFSQREGATVFMTLLAALTLTLHRASGQEDICIGSPSANRVHPELEHLIGCFSDILVLRTDLSGNPTFRELVRRTRQVTLKAFGNQDVPFTQVVETVQPDRNQSYNPLFQVMFSFLDDLDREIQMPGLSARLLDIESGVTDFDLFLEMSWHRGRLGGSLGFNTDLFDEGTVGSLLRHFQMLLSTLVSNPDVPIASVPALQRETVALAASFTADPLQAPLEFWSRRMDRPTRVRMAPYNQVFQELLNPASTLGSNRRGLNVVLVRMEDWQRSGDEIEAQGEALRRVVDDLASAVERSAAHAPVPHLVLVCPPSPTVAADAERLRAIETAERQLIDRLTGSANVSVCSADRMREAGPAEDIFDAYGEREGHLPYTSTFFAAMAALIARHRNALQPATHKVIVLDCDQTLWSGVVGEDGPAGVELDAPRRMLQELMVQQHDSGMLLCLCSKNVEGDVQEVFRTHPDMPLRPEHVIASRINWSRKSENLRALAAELELGLDSFIFIDDSPMECAEVRAACPEVLTLQLPPDAQQIPAFLRSVWTFDHVASTSTDRQRTRLYRQEHQRELARRNALDLGSFLAALEVQVRIAPVQHGEIARVSQMTQRTNQFNSTTRRRTESDVEAWIADGRDCLVVEVSDRFGDYGLVGAVLFEQSGDALSIDSLLLSCRALGRGVEHRMLERVAELALERGLDAVEVDFAVTARNAPAEQFLRSLNAQTGERRDVVGGFRFSAAAVRAAVAEPRWANASFAVTATARESSRAEPVVSGEESNRVQSFAALEARWRAERLSSIAAQLGDPRQVLEIIGSTRGGPRPTVAKAYVAPRTPTEAAVAELWSRVLLVERVGADDDFFDLGGHSLVVMKVLAELRSRTGVDLPLRAMLLAPTVAGLARAIDAARSSNGVDHVEEQVDLLSEAVLDPTIRPRAWMRPSASAMRSIHVSGTMSRPIQPGGPRHVFLTGATGFVGAFLLVALLRHTRATVHCLVRARSPEQGRQRLLQTMRKHGLSIGDPSRVVAVPGDLERPRLGLSAQQFGVLAETIDTIYHSGAVVNFVYPYQMLKAANVLGTQEILRLATVGPLKLVHHMSTLAVFETDNFAADSVVAEDCPLVPGQCPADAYGRSKWVAERLVLEARARGVPVTIYRLDDVGGASGTAACDTNAFTWRMVKGCMELGSAPVLEFMLGLTPVDFLADAIVQLSLQPAAVGQAYHLVNNDPLPWTDLLQSIRAQGYSLRMLAYDDWLRDVEVAATSPEHALFPILGLLPGPGEIDADGHDPLATDVVWDCQNTTDGLARAGLEWPRVDGALVGRWLAELARREFLPAPRCRAAAVGASPQ
jgi:thioester reductase-like protein/FkbH-like protein